MVFHSGGFPLCGHRFHLEPMHIFAERIDRQDLIGVSQHGRPAFIGKRELCEGGKDAHELLAKIITPLGRPIVIDTFHILSAICSVSLSKMPAERFGILRALRSLGLADRVFERLGIDRILQLWVELIAPFTKHYEVLLEGLPAVQGLADMRDRRVKVLFDNTRAFIGPKRVDQDFFGNPAVLARRDVAKNVAGAFCGPCIRREGLIACSE